MKRIGCEAVLYLTRHQTGWCAAMPFERVDVYRGSDIVRGPAEIDPPCGPPSIVVGRRRDRVPGVVPRRLPPRRAPWQGKNGRPCSAAHLGPEGRGPWSSAPARGRDRPRDCWDYSPHSWVCSGKLPLCTGTTQNSLPQGSSITHHPSTSASRWAPRASRRPASASTSSVSISR